MHEGLALEFLDCQFDKDVSIYSIDSAPEDTVSDEACPPEDDAPATCYVVQGEMSMMAWFASSRRLQATEADPLVLGSTGSYLANAMSSGELIAGDAEIVKVEFQGFVNVEDEEQRVAPPVAGVIGGQQLQPSNDNSNLVVGASVVGLALIALLAVMMISIKQRRGRQEAYLRHLDELSLEDDDKIPASPSRTLDTTLGDDDRVEIVQHYDGDDDDSFGGLLENLRQHERNLYGHDMDVHVCTSATCQVCQHRDAQPTFVSSSMGDGALADLRQSEVLMKARENYGSPDTVAL